MANDPRARRTLTAEDGDEAINFIATYSRNNLGIMLEMCEDEDGDITSGHPYFHAVVKTAMGFLLINYEEIDGELRADETRQHQDERNDQ